MAEKEMYDYLSSATPDYSAVALSVSPTDVIAEEGDKNVVIHEYDDGSDSAVVLSSNSIFYVILKWDKILAADAGTIVDFYHDPSKGNGPSRSFKWDHYDGHTYVVRFAGKIQRDFGRFAHRVSVKFKVLGYAT